ncbi:Hypothetical predicted protein [Olea europaea subsp. europaea]|uniref:Secreted protein n=1 Tax=Olea europaea subsp. europaea TaxID=158383 RepID=A0A8S0RIP0_OLEEU|nr:Hypothetical predicted protein [Olea europaea subsp. europaea]
MVIIAILVNFVVFGFLNGARGRGAPFKKFTTTGGYSGRDDSGYFSDEVGQVAGFQWWRIDISEWGDDGASPAKPEAEPTTAAATFREFKTVVEATVATAIDGIYVDGR